MTHVHMSLSVYAQHSICAKKGISSSIHEQVLQSTSICTVFHCGVIYNMLQQRNSLIHGLSCLSLATVIIILERRRRRCPALN